MSTWISSCKRVDKAISTVYFCTKSNDDTNKKIHSSVFDVLCLPLHHGTLIRIAQINFVVSISFYFVAHSDFISFILHVQMTGYFHLFYLCRLINRIWLWIILFYFWSIALLSNVTTAVRNKIWFDWLHRLVLIMSHLSTKWINFFAQIQLITELRCWRLQG